MKFYRSSPRSSTVLSPLAILLLVLVNAGCGRGANVEAPGADASREVGIPVEVLNLEAESFEERYGAAGVIEAFEEVTVSAEQAGRIVALTREIGEAARRGQVLVQLDDRTQAAQVQKIEAEVARAQTELQWARRDLERQKQLFETQVAAERARDEAQRRVDSTINDLSARQADLELARVELGRTRVTAPIRGRIAKRHVSTGEYVTPGKELYDLVAVSRVKFVFSVAERDVTAIQVGDKIDITIDAFSGRTFEGTLRAVSPAGSQGTRTFRVEAELDNEALGSKLLPGMSGRATVVRANYDRVVLVPESAVLRDGAASYLFLFAKAGGSDSEGTARRVDVEIIGQTGSSAVIPATAFEASPIPLIILGQAAVHDGAPVRVRRTHDTPPLTVFD